MVDALRKGPFVSFQKILDEIKDAFHPSRTAKSLEAHFYRMKRKGAVDRDIPLENLPKPSKVKRMSFSFRKARRKSEPRKRKPRPKKAEVEKQKSGEEGASESGKSGAEEKSKEENKSKSKSENKSATATPAAKEKSKKNDQNETKQQQKKTTEKKSTPGTTTSTSSDKKTTPAKKDKTPQQKKDAETTSKTPQQKKDKSTDSTKKSTTSKSTENKKVTDKSRSNSNLSRQSVEEKSENSAKKSTDKSENNNISSPTTSFKKITKDYSKAHRPKKGEEKSAPTTAEEHRVVSPSTTSTEQLKRSASSRRREKSADESSPVLSPMQPQVRSKRISERRERQMKEGTSESNSFRHADYIDSSLISTPPSAPETLPMPEDDTSNSAHMNHAMEVDQVGGGKSPRLSPQPNPVKKSRSAGTSDKFLEFETACLEEATRNQAQFEHFISSIDNVDATLAKIDYSIKEIQALQNIQKLEREIERALDMHGIRDSSLALLRGFHLRYTMKTQKIVLGRPAVNHTVDVNLLDESNDDGNRISRRQALIKLKYDGEFYIKNLGSQNLYVNGELVRTGNRKKLSHNCLIEVGNVSLIFEINKHQMQMIRDRLQELEDQELAEQQRLEEERKQHELSLAADHMNITATTNITNNNNINSQMNVNDFLADPHPPVSGAHLSDPMQLEPANGLPSTSS